jgi:hypothetical protein
VQEQFYFKYIYLIQKFNGDFTNCVQQAHHSAQNLIQLVIKEFQDLFEDTVEYKGCKVFLYKRVQILVADIWACFEGEGLGRFDDIDTITMFADYRVPQGLLFHKLLVYSDQLISTLKQHQQHHESKDSNPLHNEKYMLQRGDPMEVEIRGCSIHAVELLVKEINKYIKKEPHAYRHSRINAIIVDFYLWDLAKETEEEMNHIPIHRTRSIYY